MFVFGLGVVLVTASRRYKHFRVKVRCQRWVVVPDGPSVAILPLVIVGRHDFYVRTSLLTSPRIDKVLNSDKGEMSASKSFNADAPIINEEQSKRLYQAIDSLSKNQRIAFTLHKIEGLSYAEIAEIMNVTVFSVESLIYRARSSLQKNLIHFYRKNME
jgi:RNA polymerase sigma factor (sigma-70 family)